MVSQIFLWTEHSFFQLTGHFHRSHISWQNNHLSTIIWYSSCFFVIPRNFSICPILKWTRHCSNFKFFEIPKAKDFGLGLYRKLDCWVHLLRGQGRSCSWLSVENENKNWEKLAGILSVLQGLFIFGTFTKHLDTLQNLKSKQRFVEQPNRASQFSVQNNLHLAEVKNFEEIEKFVKPRRWNKNKIKSENGSLP